MPTGIYKRTERNYMREDISGNRYTKLIAIKFVGLNNGNQSAKWFCQCDCGNTKIATANKLKLGLVKSCGCLKTLPKGESSFNKLYDSYKRNAKYRNHEWCLTKDIVRYITKQNCHYCGAIPSQVTAPKKHNGEYVYNGMDRVDNAKGYTVDNVVPCCENCNKAKRLLPYEGFRNLINRIYIHWASK